MSDITANNTLHIFTDFYYSIDGGSKSLNPISVWPVTILNDDTSSKLTVTFEDGITFNGSDQFFICGSDNIQFGNDKKTTINFNITDYPGLIQNGTDGDGDKSKSNITIRNLDIKGTDNTTIAQYGGGIAQSYFGIRNSSDSTISIDGCSCNISVVDNAGGIAGSCFGIYASGGELSITNCYSTGNISGNSGGIAGHEFGSYASGGELSITNCYSTATKIENYSGGIAGSRFGSSALGGELSITNCYSTATKIDNSSGGIAGPAFGDSASGSSKLSITNCYSTATNIGSSSGGIAGSRFGSSASGGELSITNCYSTATNIDNFSGGIAGSGFGSSASGSSKLSITNCYSTGNISDESGGIAGSGFGDSAMGGELSITNCYHVGSDKNNPGITPGSQDKVTNCLSELKWSDVNAHIYLLGAPTPEHRSGLIWYSISDNTPYILSVFVNTIIPMINEFVKCVNEHKESSDTTCNQLYKSLMTVLNNKNINNTTANLIKKIVDKHKHNK